MMNMKSKIQTGIRVAQINIGEQKSTKQMISTDSL